MLTYSLANKPLGQLERAYYLIVSYSVKQTVNPVHLLENNNPFHKKIV